ncbi:MAG: polyphosphate polymerase domain-containing protein [Tissierellia bacterium]|nr:polyphosphate polymerase domain-containing protein [Tissierellia bacterium]
MISMKMRHEFKHIINFHDSLVLESRLRKILKADANSNAHGEYRVRSLYFETPNDRALMDKINGVNRREKFRIRYYNDDLSFIRLEKKVKINGLCNKQSELMSKDEVESILLGEYDFLLHSNKKLFNELYSKMNGQLLRPKVIVEYMRKPFIYPVGNVRITIDYDIRTGIHNLDFLNTESTLLNAADEYGVFEVKYDEFIPEFIKKLIHLDFRPTSAYSKYAVARRLD